MWQKSCRAKTLVLVSPYTSAVCAMTYVFDPWVLCLQLQTVEEQMHLCLCESIYTDTGLVPFILSSFKGISHRTNTLIIVYTLSTLGITYNMQPFSMHTKVYCTCTVISWWTPDVCQVTQPQGLSSPLRDLVPILLSCWPIECKAVHHVVTSEWKLRIAISIHSNEDFYFRSFCTLLNCNKIMVATNFSNRFCFTTSLISRNMVNTTTTLAAVAFFFVTTKNPEVNIDLFATSHASPR